ncbi:hypothetical protein L228DRAFT_14307 [Xylona heveae TC161]|uniref:GDP/GTP exchange factor Sec2 N-terminal domain-containing protein n=1 Tax=Xylona heveae (strain CBS 132557 / TC161) TaxID=1328760 RepID=A0A165JQH3_XYLHT|nr:hypothetical protein L228DRAFT_14307 [Xylona heveae TC161]KZF26514.1 hypothetical protein L228DRAFT_14307 [Xylona heveae TC161]
MSVTAAIPAAAAPLPGFGKSSLICPSCGASISHISNHHHRNEDNNDNQQSNDDTITTAQQQRVEDLETQVRFLSTKAALAENKLTEYEEELRRLKAHRVVDGTTSGVTAAGSTSSASASDISGTDNTSITSLNGATPSSASKSLPLLQTNPLPAKHSRLPSFFSGRSTSSENSKHSTTASDTSELQAALAREQALRQKAEKMLADTNGELEELSAQLFQQANEMVATERKARAKLEERVAVLERRDEDKRKRLELLEGAVNRIERVRNLLAGS